MFSLIFQTQKGKVHGSIDVGLSVMSIKKKARRIDLDTEEHIYHLKVRSISTSFFPTLQQSDGMVEVKNPFELLIHTDPFTR